MQDIDAKHRQGKWRSRHGSYRTDPATRLGLDRGLDRLFEGVYRSSTQWGVESPPGDLHGETESIFSSFFSSFFFGSKLLSRGEGVLGHLWVHLGQSIGSPDSASDVFSGGPDAGDFVLLVHLSLNHVATEVQASKCGDRQSAFSHVRRDATAGPSGHWLRVAA